MQADLFRFSGNCKKEGEATSDGGEESIFYGEKNRLSWGESCRGIIAVLSQVPSARRGGRLPGDFSETFFLLLRTAKKKRGKKKRTFSKEVSPAVSSLNVQGPFSRWYLSPLLPIGAALWKRDFSSLHREKQSPVPKAA